MTTFWLAAIGSLLIGGGGCGDEAGAPDGVTAPGSSGTPQVDSPVASDAGSTQTPALGVDGGAASSQPGSTNACLAQPLLAELGFNRLLVGGDFEDSQTRTAPFDIRYHYLAGGISAGDEVCQACDGTCAEPGKDWWGCWQDPAKAPGDYVRTFLNKAADEGHLPLFTYYNQLQASGASEGAGQIAALDDSRFMRRYLGDFRFLLQNIGGARALLHVEPDLWGYLQQHHDDPRAIPVAVNSANSTDCGDLENNAAGLGRCMVRMVRLHAPNTKVGLHASGWATGHDALYNRDAGHDVRTDAISVARYLRALAPDADFVVVDPSDRDAGYFQSTGVEKWWDASDRTLPNFQQAFTWAEALTTELQKPALWWQLPLGHEALPNSVQRWKDNRVQTLFDRIDEVARSHAFAIVFGAGRPDQTSPSTDDGHFAGRVRRYVEAGGVPVCR